MLKDSSICKACTFISSEVVWGMWGLLLKEVLEILPQEHHRCIFPVAAADPGSELYVLWKWDAFAIAGLAEALLTCF